MSKFTFDDVALAFAGIDQCAVLIQQIATTGNCEPKAFENSIKSIYVIDSPDVPTIYGGKSGLRLGVTHLYSMMRAKTSNVFEKQITRHVLAIIHAERALHKDAAMITNLQKKIQYAQSQAEFFSPTHANVIASLAKIYMDTLGTLPFKIGVIGKKEHMTNPESMQKIRALLLAGVRSAVLWQQVGGNRLQLLFSRSKYQNAYEKLIKQVLY